MANVVLQVNTERTTETVEGVACEEIKSEGIGKFA